MTGVQQVDDCFGCELEAHFDPERDAEGSKQQVLAQTVLFVPARVPHGLPVRLRHVDVARGDDHLGQGQQHDHQALARALPRRQEGGALGPPVPLEPGVHTAVHPVQQAVDVVAGHVPLLVLEQVRTRRKERQDADFVTEHEQRRAPVFLVRERRVVGKA